LPKKYKNIFPMEIFLGQVRKIMAEHGFKFGAEFDRKAGFKNKAARWFNDDYCGDSVEIDTLLSIAKSFNKSLDWLVFGEEPAQISQEIIPKSDKARPLASKDFELLNDSIEKVEEELNEEKKALTKGQKFRLILRVYNDCVEFQKKPDRDMVKRYLSVMD
jgi:hypothetical protein